jgi:hypothetical protein
VSVERVIADKISKAETDRVYRHIRPDILESLLNYAYRGVPTGGFLNAVLSNDLTEAVSRADSYNAFWLKSIVTFIYMELPAPCWGSQDKVDAWLAQDCWVQK